jgi:hypothetical protein
LPARCAPFITEHVFYQAPQGDVFFSSDKFLAQFENPRNTVAIFVQFDPRQVKGNRYIDHLIMPVSVNKSIAQTYDYNLRNKLSRGHLALNRLEGNGETHWLVDYQFRDHVLGATAAKDKLHHLTINHRLWDETWVKLIDEPNHQLYARLFLTNSVGNDYQFHHEGVMSSLTTSTELEFLAKLPDYMAKIPKNNNNEEGLVAIIFSGNEKRKNRVLGVHYMPLHWRNTQEDRVIEPAHGRYRLRVDYGEGQVTLKFDSSLTLPTRLPALVHSGVNAFFISPDESRQFQIYDERSQHTSSLSALRTPVHMIRGKTLDGTDYIDVYLFAQKKSLFYNVNESVHIGETDGL